MRYNKLAATPVPQSEPLNPRQVKNNAGGFVFELDDWKRLERFLILGSDSNTYYQKAPKLTRENAACVERCYATDPTRTVTTIVDVSLSGRAAKNDTAIFALALGLLSPKTLTRQLVLVNMYKVCRTATHLFQFVGLARTLGKGWGRALKRAVAEWYGEKSVEAIAYQAIKYRNRENYNHKRMLQSAHPKGDRTNDSSSPRDTLYRWICGKEYNQENLPVQVKAHLEAMSNEVTRTQLLKLIKEHRLPWEAIPTSVTKDPDVWKAMLPDMGLTALIRNLGGMTQYEAIKPLSKELSLIMERLTSVDELKKARIHPFNVLVAQHVYNSGRSDRGSRAWKPIANVTDALEEAFYLSFKAFEPTGKRILIGLDVSGSMSSPLMNSPLTVCAGAAAMAMTTMRAEKNWHVYAFDEGFRDLKLKASDSLAAVLKKTTDINGGGTDCALPMVYAKQHEINVDVFQVYTDNETWAGRVHPVKALQDYRKASGIEAKLVVVGMTATNFTIADPSDPGMLDVVGFDSNAPGVIANFARD